MLETWLTSLIIHNVIMVIKPPIPKIERGVIVILPILTLLVNQFQKLPISWIEFKRKLTTSCHIDYPLIIFTTMITTATITGTNKRVPKVRNGNT